MDYKVLTEDSTGYVLACGYTDLTQNGNYQAGTTTIRTHNDGGLISKDPLDAIKDWHRWNGSAYELYDNSNDYHVRKFNAERSRLFRETMWINERHQSELRQAITTTLDATQFDQWDAYWQLLRDIPEGGFDPENVTWPTQPPVI